MKYPDLRTVQVRPDTFTIGASGQPQQVRPKVEARITFYPQVGFEYGETLRGEAIAALINARGFKRIAEIGVYRGEMTRKILERCDLDEYHLIDPWRKIKGYQEPQDKGSKETWNSIYKAVQKEFGDRNAFVFTKRATSSAASVTIQDHSLDLVFIDGEHTFKAVDHDIRLWLPKIRSGGVIAGHDFAYEFGDSVVRAVIWHFGVRVNLMPDSVWWVEIA